MNESRTLKHTQEQCCICNNMFPLADVFPAAMIRPSLVETIKRGSATWNPHGYICKGDLTRFRGEYVQEILEREIGEVTELERAVIVSLQKHELITAEDIESKEALSFGPWLADRVAAVGGSWTFIIGFAVVLFIWISINSVSLFLQPFDPYPYILLNLCLSCLAAIQAPIIMMSQNRQEAKDRKRARNDYLVNLKAELEIRHLHEKVDHLLVDQWKRLVEIQQQQIEIMESLVSKN